MFRYSDANFCVGEKAFVKSVHGQNPAKVLYYIFTDYQGQTAAEFSLALDSRISPSSNISIFRTNQDEQLWGLISSDALHRTCGPYPEIELNYGDSFDFIVRTFILPILTLLVLVSNAFVCVVFSRRHMLNPVFLILLVIGFMELANSLLPLPFYIAQSYFGRRTWWEPLPRQNFSTQKELLENTYWSLGPLDIYQTSSNSLISQTSAWTTVFLPTITHTCSVWLTITLALQRMIYVSRPNDTSKICTLNRSILISFIILCGSFLIHLPLLCSHFIEFKPIHLKSTDTQSITKTKHICLSQIIPILPSIVMKCHNVEPKYMLTYFYARLVLIHLMPCGILAILTSLLVWKMRQITQLRERLNIGSPRQSKERSLTHTNKQPSESITSGSLFNCLHFSTTKSTNTSKSHRNGSIYNRNSDFHREIKHRPSKRIRKQNSMGSPQAISRMLIVVLIKFVAMHLPNAIALLVYVLITLKMQQESSDPSSDLQGNWTQSTTVPNTNNCSSRLESVEFHDSITDSSNTTRNTEPDYWARLSTMCNLIILVSYHLNFLIYYVMSTAFRETFKRIFRLPVNCHLCILNMAKHSTSLPDDTTQSNQNMNQTESDENERNLLRINRQIAPILIETQID